jgi:AcrR family transcriptional regulator
MRERKGSTTGPTVQIDSERQPVALPMAGERRERADAAANRAKILCAAQRLLAEHGVDGLTMQAVASEAGVGKGTIFHRFGDRDGLLAALVDEHSRVFQDRFLHGPPPLGFGAPAAERLEAFLVELVRDHVENIGPALVAERLTTENPPPAYGAMHLHVRTLIAEIDSQAEADALAAYLLSAISPSVLSRLLSGDGADRAALQRAAIQLAHGVTQHR